jgi:WD40 repeat protein
MARLSLPGPPTVWLEFAADGEDLFMLAGGRLSRWNWKGSAEAAGAPPSPIGDRVVSAALSPDGSRLVAGQQDGTIRTWSLADGGPNPPESAPRTGHVGSVTSLAFSDTGLTLASGGADGTIRLWDGHANRALGVFRGLRSSITALAFNPSGDALAYSWQTGVGGPNLEIFVLEKIN